MSRKKIRNLPPALEWACTCGHPLGPYSPHGVCGDGLTCSHEVVKAPENGNANIVDQIVREHRETFERLSEREKFLGTLDEIYAAKRKEEDPYECPTCGHRSD